MADKSFEELIQILRDRDIPFDRDALKAAFKAPESRSAIQNWMNEFLTPATLLTKEEATLYATLKKSGDFDRIAAQDHSAVRGLNENEVKDAIDELKRSTTAIEKQTEALKCQQNAMSSLIKNEQRASQARATSTAAQHRKWTAESAQVCKAVEELSQSLRYHVSDLEQQMKVSDSTVKQTVDSVLKSDDKLLASLQKLASDLDPINTQDVETMSRIKELSARLIKNTVEGIRTKLDRIYLEALQSASTTGSDDSQESQDLQDELESLYSEILPVAQMSAEQQFLQPALRTMAASSGKGQERAVEAVKYIHECLVFLVRRLEAYLERAEEIRCHNMALTSILDSTKAELSQVSEPTATIKSSPPKPTIHRRRTSSVTSPGRLNMSRRRSSGMDFEDLDPEQQLARTLGITLPPPTLSDHDRASTLEKILRDRSFKLNIHATNLETTTESSVASHLLESQSTLQILQDALLVESIYHKVRLVDPDIEASVEMFQQEIEDLKGELGRLDLERLQARSVHRERLIARWAH